MIIVIEKIIDKMVDEETRIQFNKDIKHLLSDCLTRNKSNAVNGK